jgi:hypothetical protein
MCMPTNTKQTRPQKSSALDSQAICLPATHHTTLTHQTQHWLLGRGEPTWRGEPAEWMHAPAPCIVKLERGLLVPALKPPSAIAPSQSHPQLSSAPHHRCLPALNLVSTPCVLVSPRKDLPAPKFSLNDVHTCLRPKLSPPSVVRAHTHHTTHKRFACPRFNANDLHTWSLTQHLPALNTVSTTCMHD